MLHPPQSLQPEQQRRSRRRLWLLVSIVALVLLSYVCFRVVTTAMRTAATTQVTQQASTPASVPSIGTAVLGGNIVAFIAKYGQPDSNSTGSADSHTAGHYVFSNHGFEVMTQGTRIVYIIANAPDNATWSLSQAKSICSAFAPSDSIFKQSGTILDAQKKPVALQMVYNSAFLSKQFPASDFKDQNGNLMTPGTFSIRFTYDTSDTSQIVSCSV